jgi:hypothetical protein
MNKLVEFLREIAGDALQDYLHGKFVLLLAGALALGFAIGFVAAMPSADQKDQDKQSIQMDARKNFFRKAEGNY